MNLSTSGLLQSARQDVVARQLNTTAKGGGIVFDPTSKSRVSNHEMDKQAEENATWFFEYRALLNSKLTTLTTALTAAYTTDLDACMGAQQNKPPTGPASPANGLTWGEKNAMQGNTGQKYGTTTAQVDPGAARSAYAYFTTYGNPQMFSTNGSWDGNPSSTGSASEGATASMTFTGNGIVGGQVTGSTTFLTGGKSTFRLDELYVDLNNTSNNNYLNAKILALSGAGYTYTKNVGNQLELTLYKFFVRPENLDILKFGLFENLYVVGTSSLPTGSQVQGSIRCNWDQSLGTITCTQERFAAFFHS